MDVRLSRMSNDKTALRSFLRRLRAFCVVNGAVTLVGILEFLVFPSAQFHSNSLNFSNFIRVALPVYFATLFRILFFLSMITLSTLSKEEIQVGANGKASRTKYPSFWENIKILCLIIVFSVPLEVGHIFSAHHFASDQNINASFRLDFHHNIGSDNGNGSNGSVSDHANSYLMEILFTALNMNGPNPVIADNPGLTKTFEYANSCLDNENEPWKLGTNIILDELMALLISWVTAFALFVIKSFIIEVIFDFFHYWVHRLFHEHKLLYRLIHRDHHKFLHPTPMTTFSAHPLETFLSNTIPLYLALSLAPVRLSYLELHIFMAYKTFVEIAGHAGIETNSTSFPQGNFLPKVFHIEMRTNDHDFHHTRVHQPCNYAKRFTLWDKVFGTYYSSDYNG